MSLRLVLPGALALLLAVPAQAQWVEDLRPLPAPPSAAPPSEGIQVHGRWTITVRNADGSIDQVVPFQNALTSVGVAALVASLVPDISLVGEVDGIRVGSSTGAHPCGSTSAPTPCVMDDIQYDFIGSLPLVEGFVVLGSFQAEQAGALDEVATTMSALSSGLAGDEFTSKQLDTPIAVAAGQSVDVRVEITFE